MSRRPKMYSADGKLLDDGRRKHVKADLSLSEKIVENMRRRGMDATDFKAKLRETEPIGEFCGTCGGRLIAGAHRDEIARDRCGR